MRVVLLSTLEPAEDAGVPRAFLQLGGRPLVLHQLSVAIALGCRKVLCLADGYPRELLAIQSRAERAGLSFRLVAGGHDLSRQVAPDDDVLVFTEGLIAAPAAVSAMVDHGGGIAVQPATRGVAAGFERIDHESAAAGLLHLPGTVVQQLADLPEDWSAPAALLRLAGQAGIELKPLPPSAGTSGRWELLRDKAAVDRFEPWWLRQRTSHRMALGPGYWLSAWLLHRIGPALLKAGTRAPLVRVAALLLLVASAAMAGLGLAPAGFALLATGWMVHEWSQLLGDIDIVRADRPARRITMEGVVAAAGDIVLVLCSMAALTGGEESSFDLPHAALISLILLALLRLLPRLVVGQRRASWFDDRLTLAGVLALVSLTGLFSLFVLGLSLLLVVVALIRSPDPKDSASTPANRAA